LIIGVVTRPFEFEGRPKEEKAQKGIEELQKYTDCTLIIPNQKIFDIIDKDTSNDEAYRKVDEVLVRAVKGISEVIIKPGKMNIDFNDLKNIMLHSGRALIGIGEASGKDRHLVALKQALNSPLLENKNIMGAKGVLVSFSSAGEFLMQEFNEVMNTVKQYTSSNALIKPGMTYDPSINKDSLKVVVIAANFPKHDEPLPMPDGLTQPETEKRWIPLDFRRYIPAKKWWDQEVK